MKEKHSLKLTALTAGTSVMFITKSLANQLFHTRSPEHFSAAVISDMCGASGLLQKQTGTWENISY